MLRRYFNYVPLFIWWKIVLLWGHWYQVLDFSWRLLWVSKAEWVLPYSHLAEVYIICSLRSTSGATCADLLAASSTACHFPTCISRGGTWLRFKQMTIRTEAEHATIVPATRLYHYVPLHLIVSVDMEGNRVRINGMRPVPILILCVAMLWRDTPIKPWNPGTWLYLLTSDRGLKKIKWSFQTWPQKIIPSFYSISEEV